MLSFFRDNKQSISFMLSSFGKHKRVFYIFLFGEIITGIFLVIFPLIAKYETDQLVDKNTDFFNIIVSNSFVVFLCILMSIFILKFIEQIFISIIDIIKYRYTRIFEIDYEKSLFQRLAYVPLGIFLNSRNKRIISQSIFGGYDVGNFIRSVVGPTLKNSVSLIGMIAVISYFHLPLILVIIISSLGIYYFQKYKEIYNLKHEGSSDYEYSYRLDRLKYEMGNNTHNVTINGGNELLEKQFEEFGIHQMKLIHKLQKSQTLFDLASFFIQNIGNIIIKAVVGYLVLQETQSLGFMTMTILYMSQFESIIQEFQHMNFQKNRFEDTLKKLKLFLGLTEKKKKKKRSKKIKFGDIKVQNLNFSYPNISSLELEYFKILEARLKKYGKRGYGPDEEDEMHAISEAKKEAKHISPDIIKDISFTFSPGNIYGLVGKNGAGKSTLTYLLLGFFDSYKGDITFGGVNYNDIDSGKLYENVSVISQEPYVLYDFSIRENILLGVKKTYSDEYIFEYLKKFGLDKKIKALRLGINTKIGYDSDFSGGEKQLLVLIRNILQDRPILIMDEGTNQLDAENELLVMDELFKNKKDKIIIFITHRMTTIRKADMIYCLENGTISDIGTHKELLKRKNIYKTFWKKQVEG